MEPLFLTHKLAVTNLKNVYNVYDFHLRDHLLTTENIYLSACNCVHKHKKRPCSLVDTPYCVKCKVANEILINYKSMLFHQDADKKQLARCCSHWHNPPCHKCLGCRTKSECIVQFPFECTITTNATCTSSGTVSPHFTTRLAHATSAREHMYNTKMPVFFFCIQHSHTHNHAHKPYSVVQCIIQTKKCCPFATFVTDLQTSFIITTVATRLRRTAISIRKKTVTTSKIKTHNIRPPVKAQLEYVEQNFVIFDPTLWREQSLNHFISLVRAVVNMPEAVLERYRRFESSNFKVTNIKKYKSGKQSIVRTAITGYETKGIYQTATISCTLPSKVVLIPQQLYDLMVDHYDLSLVAVKRDPSIKQTCMFVCRGKRNPENDVHTLVISDTIAKPLNQDQDGDKNGLYALPTRTCAGYDKRESFLHRLAKLELSTAFRTDKTLIATPRYSFSEYNLLVINRKNKELSERSEFFRRTYSKGVEHMISAGCGYLRSEYEEFCRILIEINTRKENYTFTLDDLLLKTDTLPGIIGSGSKGHSESINMLFDNLNSRRTMFEQKPIMIDQMNRYISSSKELRHTGRNQFISLYAAHDLTVFMGSVYVNRRFYADYKPFASAGTLMYTEGSLDEFIEDIRKL